MQSLFRVFRAKASGALNNLYYSNNENADASCDRYGNLLIKEALLPDESPGGFTYQAIPGLATGLIQNSQCFLTQIGGFNDSAGTVYVQIFNQIAALAGGETPVMIWNVLAGASFAWKPSRGARRFTNGIVFGVSSTRDTYTVSATTIFLFAEGLLL